MNRYKEGVVLVKIGNEVSPMIVKMGEVMDYKEGVRMRHYVLDTVVGVYEVTGTKQF